jgi:hypothetical protein
MALQQTPTVEPTAVYLLEDLPGLLRVSRRTIERLRRHGAFPIPELPSLDKRPRWSGDAILRYLQGEAHISSRRRHALSLAKGVSRA